VFVVACLALTLGCWVAARLRASDKRNSEAAEITGHKPIKATPTQQVRQTEREVIRIKTYE
jgi:hypothetical protein